MHRQHRNLVLVHQLGQRVGILAERLGLHHHLDAVVAQVGGQREGGRRALRDTPRRSTCPTLIGGMRMTGWCAAGPPPGPSVTALPFAVASPVSGAPRYRRAAQASSL